MFTNTTALCSGCPASNLQNSTYPLLCLPFEFHDELTEGKVRNLFTPKSFHAVKVQVFKEHYIKTSAEVYCEFPVVVCSLIFSLLMDTRNILAFSFSVIRTFDLSRMPLFVLSLTY